MALLFAVGSFLFALGAVPGYSQAVGLSLTSLTFFLGSLFFTSAGFLQYREAVDGSDPAGRRERRFWVWAPGNVDWLACAVQLAGTLWFNWSTGNALRHNLSAVTADQRVWRPDALGSVAFLVASGLAWSLVRADPRRPRSNDWWMAILNLLGSVAFGVSAIAAFVVPATDDVRNVQLSNLGTLVGAVCFLAGAVLLLPKRQSSALGEVRS